MDLIQKKILYLNIMYLIVFLIGITFLIMDISNFREDETIKGVAAGMVAASLAFWGYETQAYIKVAHKPEKK